MRSKLVQPNSSSSIQTDVAFTRLQPQFDDTGNSQHIQQLRARIIEVLNRGGGGHYGGCLSVADILCVLYGRILQVSSEDPKWVERDRLILSKGHAAVALYAVLEARDLLPAGLLDGYGTEDGALAGHPDMTSVEQVEFSTGSLGQGLAAGVGMALALRDRGAHVWVILGDGECQEGQVWEAAMLASRYQLTNLHAIVDLNGYQELGWYGTEVERLEPLPDAGAKWSAFGWQVIEVSGHNLTELESAMRDASNATVRPTVVIAHTIKGKGIPHFEKKPSASHCVNLPIDEANRSLVLGELL